MYCICVAGSRLCAKLLRNRNKIMCCYTLNHASSLKHYLKGYVALQTFAYTEITVNWKKVNCSCQDFCVKPCKITKQLNMYMEIFIIFGTWFICFCFTHTLFSCLKATIVYAFSVVKFCSWVHRELWNVCAALPHNNNVTPTTVKADARCGELLKQASSLCKLVLRVYWN